MHGQHLDASLFCNPRNRCAIAVIMICAGSDFKCHWDGDCVDNGIQNLFNELLISQQCRACGSPADFFGRATHIDINHLCAQRDIEPRRVGELNRFVAHYLYRTESCTVTVLLP